MQSGLYVSLSSQMALEKRLTTIADNMANVNTTGFRATEVKFDEMVAATKNKLNTKVAFVSQGNDYLNEGNGELQHTGNMLDFAIKGDAWFALDTPAGQVLTRDGRFTIKDTGELVSIRGYPVLDAGGAPIQLNTTGGEPAVGTDGIIYQGGRQIASLGLFEADVSKGYLRYENSGIMTTDQPRAVVDRFNVGVEQGYLENSNVNAMREITQLIEVNRAFESVSSLMRDSEDSFKEAVQTLGGSR
ncbi:MULTISPECIES: flagellar basal-body rod protein FlgF [Rhizobium]|uniref:Flagellar basal-body rod protein FlgF n=1 Tax=Rhizobium indicum TaxID=2583231 RepID=A0ABX6PE72_9HYPH|nr:MULTISPECIES: flagellar basal-body rod protein FlgF [Rhizobium]MBA1350031.1 flagellar basal-body rod protein FlgF [Rhizobium sp. WYCCWR 11146]NNU67968.1 flagellar basal-body rod protein FlgF [Rhizobium sp. WYCCWR 11152]QKK16646.1 flagellar basal-body rod protein FlgF [Rhizobium indicum]QKK31975.1 flagellar basal-body rod protein FlgF [Rhizobium indicum]